MTNILADLATFARLEVESGDVEPWAAVLWALRHEAIVNDEQALWLVKLYNAYDDLGSAWQVFTRWDSPSQYSWSSWADRQFVNTLPLSRERRSLRGGRAERHLTSYAELLYGEAYQREWLSRPLVSTDPRENFPPMMDLLRKVWGVGRQTAFEWAEFAAKVATLPVDTPDAYLWESTGPRESLQRIYGNPNPTREWLSATAVECKDWLADQGIEMSWWDFETVICDFNVMRKGRYYPGQHLAMIRGEIEAQDEPARTWLSDALRSVVPDEWQGVPPGVDKALARSYRDTGMISTPVRRRSVL